MTDQEFLKELDALIEDSYLKPLAEDDLTISRVMARAREQGFDVGYKKAANMLEEGVQAGKVVFLGERQGSRGPVKAWRFVELKQKTPVI